MPKLENYRLDETFELLGIWFLIYCQKNYLCSWLSIRISIQMVEETTVAIPISIQTAASNNHKNLII